MGAADYVFLRDDMRHTISPVRFKAQRQGLALRDNPFSVKRWLLYHVFSDMSKMPQPGVIGPETCRLAQVLATCKQQFRAIHSCSIATLFLGLKYVAIFFSPRV